ncbi:TIGR03943 family putative permease subunit [Nocardia pseudovaccinii]|uniref:TIGR03943 family putative permease subunit n=1 Tax=Nocardia pseudovaccinii TaxID=189540 RepID=UPI0007A3D4E1|nr:TIGR03943 family protein [Nocardia pseudovaccinii]
MKRETQNLLLLLIGSAVLWTTLDGTYLRYVKPSLYPFLLISSIGFILLALVAIFRDIRRSTASDEHANVHGHMNTSSPSDRHGGDDVPGHASVHGRSDLHGHMNTSSPSDKHGGDDVLGHASVHGRSDLLGQANSHGDGDMLEGAFGGQDALSNANARSHDDAFGHGPAQGDHEHGSGRAQWLLLAPVAALLLIAPPALGAGAAVTSSPVQVVPRDIAAEQPKLWAFPLLPAEQAPRLPIVDLVDRALQDSSHSLDGRQVTISGFIIRPKDLEQQHPDTPDADLARVVITCCVADARYVLVHLSGMPEVIEDDAWLEVRGVVETGSAQRDPDHTPTLVVTDYQRIEAPDRPYERGR